MPRKVQPRLKRPSGIEVSANGKYFYWRCVVSDLETFAPEARFKEVVAKYGSEEKLFKTYVLRPVQKMLNNGFDVKHIKELIEANKGKLPKKSAEDRERKKAIKDAKKPRKKGLKQFALGELKVEETTSSGSVEAVAQKIYPWTGNPDYFRSPPTVLNIGDETKNACLYPSRRLDNLCEGCTVFEQCVSSVRVSNEERHDPKHHKRSPKITKINSFTQ